MENLKWLSVYPIPEVTHEGDRNAGDHGGDGVADDRLAVRVPAAVSKPALRVERVGDVLPEVPRRAPRPRPARHPPREELAHVVQVLPDREPPEAARHGEAAPHGKAADPLEGVRDAVEVARVADHVQVPPVPRAGLPELDR